MIDSDRRPLHDGLVVHSGRETVRLSVIEPVDDALEVVASSVSDDSRSVDESNHRSHQGL